MTAGSKRTLAQGNDVSPEELAAFQGASRAGEIGLWSLDIARDRIVWAENMHSVHRLVAGRSGGELRSFAELVHPEDRPRVEAQIKACVSSGEPLRVQYRLPAHEPATDHSETPVWIEARGKLERGTDGHNVTMTGICQDISAHKLAEAELAMRARQQEAVAQLGERALEGTPLDEIFGEAAKIVADLVQADFAEILELTHEREDLTARASFGWSASLEGQAVATSAADTQVGAALRSKTPIVVSDFSAETRFDRPDRLAEHEVRSGVVITVPGAEGTPFGVIAVFCRRVRCISGTDVRFLQSVANVLGSAIRSRQDFDRSELLVGELRHRVGNLFSLVQALHRQTAQNASDARDLETKFSSRLASLATAHSLILDGGWQKTSVRALLERALAPYIERVVFSGVDARLPADAAFSFSMALHELATNANKYGALASSKGKLRLDLASVPDALGHKLVLVWKEQDGPPPPGTTTEGFGSKLIHQVVERQLGGQVTRVVEPDGLRVTMEFPVG
jgi:two-component sensor histidine kinase